MTALLIVLALLALVLLRWAYRRAWRAVRFHAAGVGSFQRHAWTGKRRWDGVFGMEWPLGAEPWLRGGAFSPAALACTLTPEEARAEIEARQQARRAEQEAERARLAALTIRLHGTPKRPDGP